MTHHCPACGAEREHVPRYPWHLCNDCRRTACDCDGTALRAGNESLSGGFVFSRDGEAWFRAPGVLALVRERPVLLHEARFGGIVAEPWAGRPAPEGYVDLTRRWPDEGTLDRVR